jgi:hypothetical protein
MNASLTCSFCGKSESDHVRIVPGPTVYICEECIDVATEHLRATEIKVRQAWMRKADWSTLLEHQDSVLADAETWAEGKQWRALVQFRVDGATCDDSMVRADPVFASREAAEQWCERVIDAVAPLLKETKQ